jgi:hypothetical protein
MKTLWIVVLSAMLFTCEEEGKLCCGPSNDDSVTGTWLLYERGYSPGTEYIIDKVPPLPAQTITFDASGSMTTTMSDLKAYQYYEKYYDQTVEAEVIAFFEGKPMVRPDLQDVQHSYNVTFDENGNMKLGFRYCYEGCHFGFKRQN